MLKEKSYCLLFSLLAFIFFSCVSQKKVAPVKKELTSVNDQLLKYENDLNGLDDQRRKKQELNEIDDTVVNRFQTFISNTNTEINAIVSDNNLLIHGAIVNKADWEHLNKNLFKSQQTSKKINEKVMILSDLINRTTVIRLDQDVIFEPGQYTVTNAVANAIGKFFEPAAKEIDQFVNKYPDFPLSLIISAKGYADGTSISEGTILYKNLRERLNLNTKVPDNKELNKELSRARAEAVIDLFKNFTVGMAKSGNNIKHIAYIYEGKGEVLPNPSILDYKTDDARRRIVLLYWSVFPDD